MTLYYSLTFALLMLESALFMVLIMPMPFSAKKTLFHFLASNRFVGKIQYGLKITFIFIAVLAVTNEVDAVQRMVRVVGEGQKAKENPTGVPNAQMDATFSARKFYSERNVYLTGFTLFLSLILSRVFVIMLDLIATQEELAALKTNPTAVGGSKDEVVSLKKQLAAKQRDLDTLLKQSEANLDALKVGSQSSNKKKD